MSHPENDKFNEWLDELAKELDDDEIEDKMQEIYEELLDIYL